MSTLPPDDPAVLRCVAEALERRDAGEEVDLATLCEGDPALLAAVSASLGLAPTLLDLQQRARTFDRLVGERLAGRYRLRRRIGSGAMGHVYRAHDEELDRLVAVKLLRTDLLVGESARRRFEREAETLGRLRHGNVVTVFDRGIGDDGTHFLVMELLDGVPLHEILTPDDAGRADPNPAAMLPDAPLPPSWIATAVRWTAELADGLEAAHAAGVRHRDVKPTNIFIRSDGRPILLDFGIATRLDQQTLATHDGALGTPAYMAPEQFRRSTEPGPQVDVYGLGATLYHLLAGRPPFEGTFSEVLRRVERGEPAPLSTAASPPPRDLRAIVEKAMATSPADRYPTARAMAEDLRAFLAYRPVTARPVGTASRLWRRARRSTALRAAAAGAILVAAAAFAASSWQNERRALDQSASLEDSRLRPDLSISGPRHARVIEGPQARHDVERRLDRIVAGSLSPLPGRQRRAAFRLDHGDPSGAAEDMAAIADHEGSRFLRRIASVYAALPADADSRTNIAGIDFENALSPAERYVAGFHMVRNRDADSAAIAVENLRVANTVLAGDGITPPLTCSDELRMVVLLSLAAYSDDITTRRRHYQQAYDLAQATGRRLGRGSATIHYAAATALLSLGREPEAIPEFERTLELIPDHFGTRLNLASLLRRLERFEAAQIHLSAARDLQPFNHRVLQNQVQLWLDTGRYDEAAELLESEAATQFSPEFRSSLRANVAVERAVDAYVRGRHPERARSYAAQALREFDVLADLVPGADPGLPGLMATALAAGRPADVFDPLLGRLTENPAAWTQLGELTAVWPDDIDGSRSAALREYLIALVRTMAPGRHDYLYSPTGRPTNDDDDQSNEKR